MEAATVTLLETGRSTRIALFPASAMYTFPAPSTISPAG